MGHNQIMIVNLMSLPWLLLGVVIKIIFVIILFFTIKLSNHSQKTLKGLIYWYIHVLNVMNVMIYFHKLYVWHLAVSVLSESGRDNRQAELPLLAVVSLLQHLAFVFGGKSFLPSCIWQGLRCCRKLSSIEVRFSKWFQSVKKVFWTFSYL